MATTNPESSDSTRPPGSRGAVPAGTSPGVDADANADTRTDADADAGAGADGTLTPRDRAAATESLPVVCEAPDLFHVYSGERYYVTDVRAPVCECADWLHRQPDGGCKHIRRVQMVLGRRLIPLDHPDVAADLCRVLLDQHALYTVRGPTALGYVGPPWTPRESETDR